MNPALHNKKIEVMNFLNEIASTYPDAISFAPGRPVEDFFDVDKSFGYLQKFSDYCADKTRVSSKTFLNSLGQYGRTNGILGDFIQKLLINDEGFQISANDVVITVGSQEAMFLCLLTLFRGRADVILITDPAYIGMSGAANILGIEVISVPLDPAGIDFIALDQTLIALKKSGKNPKALYLSPDFSNPTGITLSRDHRKELLDLTKKHNILIIEDHAYSYFDYDSPEKGSLKLFPNSDHVIYLGSFSKSIYPGVRIGFLVANIEVVDDAGKITTFVYEVSKLKSLLTVNTSPLCQAIVGGILLENNFSLKSYAKDRLNALKLNRDVILDALDINFPASEVWARGIQWNRPSGGFFLTLSLPFALTDEDLIESAMDYKVLWTPMRYFHIHDGVSNDIRLSFSYVTPDQIRLGIKNLGTFVKKKALLLQKD
ncbi:PLP-dependent aminotransferase family protein [Polynucleobacter sp. MG-28-Ekke-A2]|uniref:aminotransferase-like domain-containing protein n=1 Tax=Polynucleobacter sp. MG-28-Ekke-A2 TaxID=3108276 RepID=UPI002B232AF0|nr:PLP-dependent aminotransferase family protein [Polynucleobacter sp. MG-28-Ekke-A2]MEA9602668.1 PLP-dependent aminotransferase family protein [Polynucleobacter sp. MG-28-Ekke-A2]